MKIKEVKNLCEILWYELCGFCLSELGKSHYKQKQCFLHVQHFVMLYYVMLLCYVMLCNVVMLCYVMLLCCVMLFMFSMTGDIYYFLLLC